MDQIISAFKVKTTDVLKAHLLQKKKILFSPTRNTVSPLHTNFHITNFQIREHAHVCQLWYCTTVLFKVLFNKT